MTVPETRYVETDGARLGWITWGSGPSEVVLVPSLPSHLDLAWTDRSYADMLHRLGEFARVVMYDRRGTGTSDPLDATPTLEREAADLEAVMDAAGVTRATVCGYAVSTAIAAFFAATRPHRTDRLALLGGFARGWNTPPPWPSPISEEMMARVGDAFNDAIDHWGEGRMLTVTAPDFDTPRNRRLFAMFERVTCSRAAARALIHATGNTDLTDVLPRLTMPTLMLVTRSVADPAIHEYAASLIPTAELRYLQPPSRPTGLGDLWEPVFDEIEMFVTGHRRAATRGRMYAAVLFTDVIASTEHAARMGDTEWRSTLLRHNSLLLDEVELAGGHVADFAGDGALSIFDGPEQAINCAAQVIDKVHELGVQIRAGVHAGECERVGDDVAGLAVHIGARVAAKAAADEILTTEQTRAVLAGSGFEFLPRGEHELKGVPGAWKLLAVARTPQRQLQPDETARELRAGDRAVLIAARRAPRLLQTVGSLANRRQRTRLAKGKRSRRQ